MPLKSGDCQLMWQFSSLMLESLGAVPSRSVSGTVTNTGPILFLRPSDNRDRHSRVVAGEVSLSSVLIS